jgi:hypothetical protein
MNDQPPVLAVVDREAGKIRLMEGIHFTPNSMEFGRRIRDEDAGRIDRWLNAVQKASPMWRGDFLNYIEKVLPETWTQYIPEGYVQKTATKWMRVCAKIPPALRRDLTMTHLEIIAGCCTTTDEIRWWTDKASDEGMTTRELKEALKPTQPKHKTCPNCGYEY